MWSYIMITLVSIAASFKVLNFHFWHDDYAVLYQSPDGTCHFTWPYQAYCVIFPILKNFFGLRANYYFLLGVVLFVLSALIFYKFLKLLNKNIAFWSAVLYGSIIGGQGAFFESYSIITTFASFIFLFAHLHFLIKYLQSKNPNKYLFFNLLVTFVFSIVIFQARSATYFIPSLFAIWLFEGTLSVKNKILLSTAILLTHIIFFIGPATQNATNSLSYFDHSLIIEFLDLVKTTYQVQVAQWLPTHTGIAITIFTVYILLIINSLVFKKTYRSLLIFASILTAALYLPYGLKTDGPLNPNGRYVFFLIPGLVIILSTSLSRLILKALLIFVIFIALSKTNSIFVQHIKQVTPQKIFYKELITIRPILSPRAVVFVDTSSEYLNLFDDTFRVGFLPPEAALATYYPGISYNNIKIITHRDELFSVWPVSDVNNYYYLHFDPKSHRLTDYTDQARKQAEQDPNYSFSHGIYVPAKLTLELSATIKQPQYPHKFECDLDPDFKKLDVWKKYLSIAAQSSLVKQSVTVVASNSADDVYSYWLTDSDYNTVWYPSRQEWIKADFPTITIEFDSPTEISNLILYSTNNSSLPSSFKLFINNQELSPETNPRKDSVVLKFPQKIVEDLRIEILDSVGGDIPTITEIEFVKFENFEDKAVLVKAINNCPAGELHNLEQFDQLKTYFIESGIEVCLEGQQFRIYPNGRLNTYYINIPPLSGKPISTEISCNIYPLSIEIKDSTIRSFVQQ